MFRPMPVVGHRTSDSEHAAVVTGVPDFEAGDWARLSVGRILLQCLIEWCIVNRIDSFDLTVGDEEYKRFWADTRLKLYESRYAQTVRGACFLAGSRLRALAGRIGVAVR